MGGGEPFLFEAWEAGRQLKQMEKNNLSVTFRYNEDGIRTEKSVGTSTVKYIEENGTILYQTDGTSTLHFRYNSESDPLSVCIDGTEYYYLKNIQGDITGIVDAAGSLVVEYTYDAWGKLLSITGSLADTVGVLNPLRYRGYYYDTETGLYYLQSRYYNPEWGRFINADSERNGGHDLLGYNRFAYCANNPLHSLDKDGKKIKEIWNKTNLKEKILAAMFPASAIIAFRCKNKTNEVAQRVFGARWHDDNGDANAFRHCFWNALMAFRIGSYKAKLFADAHEWRSGVSSRSDNMDFHNNRVGRRLGSQYYWMRNLNMAVQISTASWYHGRSYRNYLAAARRYGNCGIETLLATRSLEQLAWGKLVTLI